MDPITFSLYLFGVAVVLAFMAFYFRKEGKTARVTEKVAKAVFWLSVIVTTASLAGFPLFMTTGFIIYVVSLFYIDTIRAIRKPEFESVNRSYAFGIN